MKYSAMVPADVRGVQSDSSHNVEAKRWPCDGSVWSLRSEQPTPSCDSSTLDVLKLDTDELANQLTLLDVQVFLKVHPQELAGCGWNRREKVQLAPNVVALTGRFNHVGRRERQLLQRLASLFSEEDNFGSQRSRLRSALARGSPFVPHLGPYLRDLLHMELCAPQNDRGAANVSLLGCLGALQSSCQRFALNPNASLQAQLMQPFYLEELQKFLQEDSYRESLRLEPPGRQASLTLLAPPSEPSPPSGSANRPPRFIPGHRKARSLGTNVLLSGPSTTSNGWGDAAAPEQKGRLLLDDSVAEGAGTVLWRPAALELWEPPAPLYGWEEELATQPASCQGCVRRKTLLKDGRRPAMSSWLRYWVELRGNSLVFYSPKSLLAKERSDFKRQPCKQSCIAGWVVLACPESDSFQLLDPARGSRYKFRPAVGSSAHDWCACLSASAGTTL
ncbi:ras-specific guanine nucleotide-releasing factor RalGPS1-like isoform X4 [Dermacentor variabilis]|uniref:ras-specific guanine nucleotide-releasing factor RalGPS1-like isoform X4 n=1 Tax=Dermacentor variabilis TaxID=34621 RepID=UPI003F5BA43C